MAWCIALIILIVFTIYKSKQLEKKAFALPVTSFFLVIVFYILFVFYKMNSDTGKKDKTENLNFENNAIGVQSGKYELDSSPNDSLILGILGESIAISGDTLLAIKRLKTEMYTIKKATKYFIEINNTKIKSLYIDFYNDSTIQFVYNNNKFIYLKSN
ncbi:MAG: hypothetical protein ACT4ON_02900 [Bacteroidota bacterium]